MSSDLDIDDPRVLAIQLALSSFLTDSQIASALQLWHEKYAHQPIFSVQYFARDCCAMLGMGGPRSDLLKNLVKELYMQLHTIENVQIHSTQQRNKP